MRSVLRLSVKLTLCLMMYFFCGCPTKPPAQPTVWSIDGIDFVHVPAGAFMMGAPESEADSTDAERPVHQVQIGQGFYISQKEITQAQWHQIVGSDVPYSIQDTLDDNLPMRRISWYDTQTFIEALNTRNSLSVFRLPTEAEWELAARGAMTTRFYWGDDPTLTSSDSFAWTSQNSDLDVHHVGSLLPNLLGLYDVSGNVVEWVEDRYHDDYTSAPTDGSAWGTPEPTAEDDPLATIYGVVRGGCYNWTPSDARCAFRYAEYADSRRPYTGFRVVMEE